MNLNFESCPDQSHLFNLIKTHLSQRSLKEALVLYYQIRRKGNSFSCLIPLVLKACACIPSLINGKALHGESLKFGFVSDVTVGTSLINMYAKCGDVISSRKVFDEMSERNVVTWNAMIGGYMRNWDTEKASALFGEMPVTKNSVTWMEMIKGFARRSEMGKARELFERVPDEVRDVRVWTAMVEGYASNGEMKTARELFEEMPDRNFFGWSSMVSGYCRRGDVDDARRIFDRVAVRSLVLWNSMISGFAQNGYSEEAIEAFYRMQVEGFEPDEVTVASVLSACSQLGRLDVGRNIHFMINHKGIKLNVFVLNALVDMYAKCGDLTNARVVFDSMNERNTACWNSMIAGLAIHGQSKEALNFFGAMEDSNVKPDGITFLSVLSACVHGGFVDDGLEIFSKLGKYSLVPTVKHYGCLVDLLGRAGRLKEAYGLIKMMPVKPNDVVLGALLGACRIHSDAETAEQVMKEIGLTENTIGCKGENHYILVSNMYANSERWERAERLRTALMEKGLQKTPGCSSVMLN